MGSDFDYMINRAGIPNTFARLVSGKRTVVAYLGGSITAGAGASQPSKCYRSLLTKHLKNTFPETEVVEVHAAIGGTDSWLGAFRLSDDVLRREPDLVIVEFAVNDGDLTEKQSLAAMEGIVRQIRAFRDTTEILFVYTLVEGHMDDIRAGRLPPRMAWHERIAEHYSIPSIHMARYAAARIDAGQLTFEQFAADGVHPTDAGYALYFDILKSYVESCRVAAIEAGEFIPRSYPMPSPNTPDPLEKVEMFAAESATLDGEWRIEHFCPAGKFKSIAVSETPLATLSVRFRGGTVGYFDTIGPDTGDLEYSLDGGPWTLKRNYDQWCAEYYRPHCRLLSDDLAPDEEHFLRLRVADEIPAGSKGRCARIAFLLIGGTVVQATPR